MSVSLVKGGNVSLSKEAGGNLSSVTIGLGWDVRTTAGAQFDLDASALACGKNGKVKSDQHFVFYNNEQSPDGAVVYGGDNRTGQGDGDDEQIFVKLLQLQADVEKVVIVVSIYDADVRRQNFGQVPKSFVRIVDDVTGTELARFDLGEDFSTETAVIFGEVYRHNGDWKFRAIGQGYSTGLAGVALDFGVNLA